MLDKEAHIVVCSQVAAISGAQKPGFVLRLSPKDSC